MSAARQPDLGSASAIGGRTLEVFARTPGLNRWLYSKLEPHIHGRVLEIGSGIGNLSRHIAERATTAVFSDMEDGYLSALRSTFQGDSRIAVVRYDLDGPPPAEIAGRRFDTVVAVNVLEHIRDDGALVRALAGLLEPEGKLAVYVPACPIAFGSLDRALGHFRRYTPDSLVAVLAGAGLEPVPPRYMNLPGLLGWTVNGRIIRRERLSDRQVAVFERLLPVLRLEDRIRLPIGLGLHTAARKPPRGRETP
jgi:SAM-dependent methyltransferase